MPETKIKTGDVTRWEHVAGKALKDWTTRVMLVYGCTRAAARCIVLAEIEKQYPVSKNPVREDRTSQSIGAFCYGSEEEFAKTIPIGSLSTDDGPETDLGSFFSFFPNGAKAPGFNFPVEGYNYCRDYVSRRDYAS